MFKTTRNSRMEMREVYFWTSSIVNWHKLLESDPYKEVVLGELRKLVHRNLIRVYGFVIMPNHLHFIWEMIEKNGKEMPNASFNKATAHEFVKDLKAHNEQTLFRYTSTESSRSYRIWQRDPLAVLMDSREKVEQKLDYIHDNPLQSRWNLVEDPSHYRWSSASFYQTGKDPFGFLTHYMDRF